MGEYRWIPEGKKGPHLTYKFCCITGLTARQPIRECCERTAGDRAKRQAKGGLNKSASFWSECHIGTRVETG